MGKKKSEHYVNNKEFLEALIAYREKVAYAKENDLPKPRITNYIGECFLKIATHLSYKPNFVNYMFREDMISDGIENCLHRSTKVLTIEYGPIEIEKILGEEVTVRCIDGEWRKAKVKSYGKQMLYEYGFASSEFEGVEHKVIATENHRWFVSSRRNEKEYWQRDYKNEVITNLKIGDVLQNAPAVTDYDERAVIQGMLFGSGLTEVSNLPFTKNSNYIAGFIYGWWSVDRHKTLEGNLIIATDDVVQLEWLTEYAGYAGLQPILCDDYRRTEKYAISLSFPERYNVEVVSIEEYGEDEVYCLEEPVTNSFVLANGLLTGNCVQYIHNFDPEKSKNPFAYFTQIIHYAFLRRIQKEKRQLETKMKIIEKTGYDEVMVVDNNLLATRPSEYNTIKDNISYKNTNR